MNQKLGFATDHRLLLINADDFGINPTHLDSHAGSIRGISTGRDFLEITFDLCESLFINHIWMNRIIHNW